MPVFSAIFLVIALVLGVVIGPQTRPWTWGPAMLALGISVVAAIPVFWQRNRPSVNLGLISLGTLTAAWFAWRAWNSPVNELGQADILLLAGAVGTFISIRAIEGNALGEKILGWGIALLLLVNIVVVGKQAIDPSFSPIFRSRASGFPSGFYAHYNEAANYLIASSLLVAAAALFGKHHLITRLLWGVIAIAGLAAVYLTHSRGGILGAAVGGGVFGFACLVAAKRSGTRWFAPALIAIPILGLALSGFLYSGWQEAQRVRQINVEDKLVDGVMDNNCRLPILGMAMSCIGQHPLTGGGSRSFSWECYQFSDTKNIGNTAANKPEFVHNELVQTTTDYGIIGMGVFVLLLGSLVISAVIYLLFHEIIGDSTSAVAWRIGGLAALAGMFVQSCFSFVFHLFPGIILLGICLGQLCHFTAVPSCRVRRLDTSILLSGAALISIILLIPMGWKGIQVTRSLWPVYLSKVPLGAGESKIAAFTDAIRLWPQHQFYEERAVALQKSLQTAKPSEVQRITSCILLDLEKASELHPYAPGPVVNLANLLSQLERNDAAENAYKHVIQLEGGMEPAFLGHFSFATHLRRKSLRQFSLENPVSMLASIEAAAEQMEISVKKIHGSYNIMYEPRVSIHESLGVAREANGDYDGAMKAYDFAATLPYGLRVHYRAGVLHRKIATAAWTDHRPGEALYHFMEAKVRIAQAANNLPDAVTLNDQAEYLAYLDKAIDYLKGAKVEPIKAKK
jgi:O-antigen ligase/tetratricopeptide (TPR) repeat protein